MNLTTLTAVKAYLGMKTSANQDDLINALIPKVSDHVRRLCGREFPYVQRVGVRFSGTGGTEMVLPDAPIVSVEALYIDGLSIPASSDGITQSGYSFDDKSIWLTNFRFTRASKNVSISWTAGYVETLTETLPADGIVEPDAIPFIPTALAVSYTSNGTAFAEVSTGNVAVGQYKLKDGRFTFSTSDAGQSVDLRVAYVPDALEQAAIETIGLKIKQRDNLGVNSKTLAGETIAYSDKDMTPATKALLAPFVRRSYGY